MGQALWAVSFEAGREVGVWVGWFGCDLFLFPSFLSLSSHFLALHFLAEKHLVICPTSANRIQ